MSNLDIGRFGQPHFGGYVTTDNKPTFISEMVGVLAASSDLQHRASYRFELHSILSPSTGSRRLAGRLGLLSQRRPFPRCCGAHGAIAGRCRPRLTARLLSASPSGLCEGGLEATSVAKISLLQGYFVWILQSSMMWYNKRRFANMRWVGSVWEGVLELFQYAAAMAGQDSARFAPTQRRPCTRSPEKKRTPQWWSCCMFFIRPVELHRHPWETKEAWPLEAW